MTTAVRFSPLLASVLCAACGSGGDDAPGTADAAVQPTADAAAQTGPDAATKPADAASSCTVDAVPDFDVHPGYGLFGGYNEPSMEWHVFYDVVETDSNGDGNGDYLGGVYLRNGRGLFAGGIAPGKYEITGDDARADSCAICVWAQSRSDVVEDDLYRFHAVKGVLYVDSVDQETDAVSGRVVDVEFVSYEVGNGGGDACVRNDGSCGMTWCSANGTCAAQVSRPEICGFRIGELSFSTAP